MSYMDRAAELERGRESYATRAWADAYERLSRADGEAALEARDLELLANSAYMVGRDADYLRELERAHHAYTEAGELTRAVRCAFWLGIALMLAGEGPRAAGWFSRGQRLLARVESDCVERGYLLTPVVLEHKLAGDHGEAYAVAAEAAAIGERFGDSDLVALTVQEQGHALVLLGRTKEGLRLIDEVMVSVTAGELSPIVTGLIYCNTIAFCQSVYQVRRARDWTAALTRWCEEQPEMVAHSGVCLVHRAEIMQLEGAWLNALAEAQRARERFSRWLPRRSPRRTTRAWRVIARRRSTGCAGSARPPRRLIERRASAAPSRSPASPCCGSSRATARPRRPGSAGRWRR